MESLTFSDQIAVSTLFSFFFILRDYNKISLLHQPLSTHNLLAKRFVIIKEISNHCDKYLNSDLSLGKE